MQYDVIVIGGGASGIAAAVSAAEQQAHVLLIDQNDRLGRKILASGNGRCNILNCGNPQYYGDPDFAKAVLTECPYEELVSFFRQYGLFLTEEAEGRIYPLSFQSGPVMDVLKTALQILNVEILLQSTVCGIRKEAESFAVSLDNGLVYASRNVIVSCGSCAQPKLGGSASGYELLSSFGHSCTELFPSLVPVMTDSVSVSGLSGIRARCTVAILDGDTVCHRENGEVLFTDYGISGICIMQCSRFIHGLRQPVFELNFLHGVFDSPAELRQELVRRRELFGSSSPVMLLDGILSARISYAVLKQAGIPLRGESCSDLNEQDLGRVSEAAFHYRIRITGTKGFDYAQVAAGGAACPEFDSRTMESRRVSGLYAAGEVLNVDGDCGGFNLMFAFASGRTAGRSAGLRRG